jgi:hypothetical protein
MHMVENPGEGVAQIFAKMPKGQCFLNKIARASPILGFIAFLLTLNKIYFGSPMLYPKCSAGSSWARPSMSDNFEKYKIFPVCMKLA